MGIRRLARNDSTRASQCYSDPAFPEIPVELVEAIPVRRVPALVRHPAYGAIRDRMRRPSLLRQRVPEDPALAYAVGAKQAPLPSTMTRVSPRWSQRHLHS